MLLALLKKNSSWKSLVISLFFVVSIFSSAPLTAHAFCISAFSAACRLQHDYTQADIVLIQDMYSKGMSKDAIQAQLASDYVNDSKLVTLDQIANDLDTVSRGTQAKHTDESTGCSVEQAKGTFDVIFNSDCWVPSAANTIGKAAFGLATWFLALAGFILEAAIKVTTTSSLYNTDSIKLAWGIFRDFVNMFFIFIVLYLGFMTILQAGSVNTKKILVNVILVGLFLNFSFFLTTFVIDIGNVFGQSLLTAIKSGTPQGEGSLADILVNNLHTTSLSQGLSDQALGNIQVWDIALMNLLGSVVLLIAGFVFLAAAVLFVLRTITLIFVIVAAPVAFAAVILPQTKNYWSLWVGKLIGSTFVLPIYLLLLTVVIMFTSNNYICTLAGPQACGGESLSGALTVNNTDESSKHVGVVINYMIIIGMLIATQKASDAVAGQMSKTSSSWAGKLTGAAVGATAGFAAGTYRNSVGRAAIWAQDSKYGDRLRETARDGGFAGRMGARLALKGGDALSRSSGDVRNIAGMDKVGRGIGLAAGQAGMKNINVGKGKVGGQRAAVEEKIKRQHQNEERKVERMGHDKKAVEKLEKEIGEYDEAAIDPITGERGVRTGLVDRQYKLRNELAGHNTDMINHSADVSQHRKDLEGAVEKNRQNKGTVSEKDIQTMADNLENAQERVKESREKAKDVRDNLADTTRQMTDLKADVTAIKRIPGIQHASALKNRGAWSWAQLRTAKRNEEIGKRLKNGLRTPK